MSEPAEIGKCRLPDFCVPMDRVLQEANAAKKGLSPVVTTDILKLLSGAREHDRTIGVVYKIAANDRGIMLNTCPWCGEPLRGWSNDTDGEGD